VAKRWALKKKEDDENQYGLIANMTWGPATLAMSIAGSKQFCPPLMWHHVLSGWWFGTFFIFPNSWDDDPI
jgi:hypothetical protein